ncbi:hypothetical protein Neosp_009730 [[Neocosmospora] mangrovei]
MDSPTFTQNTNPSPTVTHTVADADARFITGTPIGATPATTGAPNKRGAKEWIAKLRAIHNSEKFKVLNCE